MGLKEVPCISRFIQYFVIPSVVGIALLSIPIMFIMMNPMNTTLFSMGIIWIIECMYTPMVLLGRTKAI